MSSNHDANETTFYFDLNHQQDRHFTDLHKCDDADNDSQLDFDYVDNTHQSKRLASAVNHPKSSNDIIDLIRKDLYHFVFMPIAKQYINYVQCRLTRNKYDMLHTFRLDVELENAEEPLTLLTAEKQTNLAGRTEYLISITSRYTNESYSAVLLSSNVTGTNYSLFYLNEDERQEIAIILYESNFLGLRGPRKIEVLLPKFNKETEPLFDENDIAEYDTKDHFIHLHNKLPEWNAQSSGYVLKFDGKNRVTKPSIKNFIMVIENDEQRERIVMQFGRMVDDEFSCDFRYPLTLIQAFGIALSAFDSRLFRE